MAERFRPVAKTLADPIARVFARLGFTPNGLTVVGVVITALGAAIVAGGNLVGGAIVLLLAAAFDLLDGTLARLTGQTSDFGAFLDSTLDRLAEAIVLFGLSAYFLRIGSDAGVLLSFATLVGSFLVSYARARAEALNIDCQVGWLARPERVILIVLGLVTGWIVPVLWLLAIFTNATAGQRVVHVWRTTRHR